MKQIRKFVEMYNATSVESPEGSNRLETYQAWLERQLQRRIEIIEELKAERKQPPKTAEEILANKGFIVTCHEEDKTGVRTMLIDPIIEAMEEYAALKVKEALQSNTPKGITDEEIRDYFNSNAKKLISNGYTECMNLEAFMKAINWVIKRMGNTQQKEQPDLPLIKEVKGHVETMQKIFLDNIAPLEGKKEQPRMTDEPPIVNIC